MSTKGSYFRYFISFVLALGIGVFSLSTVKALYPGSFWRVVEETNQLQIQSGDQSNPHIRIHFLEDGSVGIGGPPSNQSVLLELSGAQRGLLIPRLATTLVVDSPQNGMLIYDKSESCFKVFQDVTWSACLNSFGNVQVANAPPQEAEKGSIYFDISDETLYLKRFDNWVQLGGDLAIIGTQIPTAAKASDIFFNSESQELMIYDGSDWQNLRQRFEEWVSVHRNCRYYNVEQGASSLACENNQFMASIILEESAWERVEDIHGPPEVVTIRCCDVSFTELPYWSVSPWSECLEDQQQRTIACIDPVLNQVIDDAACDNQNLARPDIHQTCENQPIIDSDFRIEYRGAFPLSGGVINRGEGIWYEIMVENVSNYIIEEALVVDTLEPGFEFDSLVSVYRAQKGDDWGDRISELEAPEAGNVSIEGDQLTISFGDLAVGERVLYKYGLNTTEEVKLGRHKNEVLVRASKQDDSQPNTVLHYIIENASLELNNGKLEGWPIDGGAWYLELCDGPDGCLTSGDEAGRNINVDLCGDGAIDTAEGCDDENRIDGDGCNWFCQEETYLCEDGSRVTHPYECEDPERLEIVLEAQSPRSGGVVHRGDKIWYTVFISNNQIIPIHDVHITESIDGGFVFGGLDSIVEVTPGQAWEDGLKIDDETTLNELVTLHDFTVDMEVGSIPPGAKRAYTYYFESQVNNDFDAYENTALVYSSTIGSPIEYQETNPTIHYFIDGDGSQVAFGNGRLEIVPTDLSRCEGANPCYFAEQCDGPGCIKTGVRAGELLNSDLCGNGVLNLGETCDDGANIDGDGCNAYCQFEYFSCGNGIQEELVKITRTCPVGIEGDCVNFGLDYGAGMKPEICSDGHNTIEPLDVDMDGYLSQRDAELIMSYLDQISRGGDSAYDRCYDVDDSGYVSALDALIVINALADTDPNACPDGSSGNCVNLGVDYDGRGTDEICPDGQNVFERYDVNMDGYISEVDGQIVINALDANINNDPLPWAHCYDVNGNGEVSPLDVLNIINHLNFADPIVSQSYNDECPEGETCETLLEGCDDGNLIDGDGCNSLCYVEGSYCGNGIEETRLTPVRSCPEGIEGTCLNLNLNYWQRTQNEVCPDGHNIFNEVDVDLDGFLTKTDAQLVMDYLIQVSYGGDDTIDKCYDVNDSGNVSALDALIIINAIAAADPNACPDGTSGACADLQLHYAGRDTDEICPDGQNVFEPYDVNMDGYISEIDATIVINALENDINDDPLPWNHCYDLNGSGEVTPLDALNVINYINFPHPLISETDNGSCPPGETCEWWTEECDDNNNQSRDGCSAMCVDEVLFAGDDSGFEFHLEATSPHSGGVMHRGNDGALVYTVFITNNMTDPIEDILIEFVVDSGFDFKALQTQTIVPPGQDWEQGTTTTNAALLSDLVSITDNKVVFTVSDMAVGEKRSYQYALEVLLSAPLGEYNHGVDVSGIINGAIMVPKATNNTVHYLVEGDGSAYSFDNNRLESVSTDPSRCNGEDPCHYSEQCDGFGCLELSQSGELPQRSLCGNSLINLGEQCDDGNTIDGDGCSAYCQREVFICGNGIREDLTTKPLECLDPNIENCINLGLDYADLQPSDIAPLGSNIFHPLDVDMDNQLTEDDAQIIIDYMDDNGLGQPAVPDIGYDVNSDGVITPLDSLLVINAIAAQDRWIHPDCEGEDCITFSEECDDGNLIEGDGCNLVCEEEL